MKRLFDLMICLLLAPPVALLLMAVAILVRHRLGSPVLFRQNRIGLYERPFVIYKFRTMTESLDPAGNLREDRDRLTDFGEKLRALSLDELPQLWNVLKGDMSLVGPRPLLPQYLPRYTVRQRRRHEIKPGITGWSQVNGRNAVSWAARLNLDVWYVDHRRHWLDVRILGLTLLKVLKREGIRRQGYSTMPEFMGSALERRTK
jgi:sugar transferase EpsL